ncbi:HNH endonuclease signature motif containing protein [Gordonia sinesedis]
MSPADPQADGLAAYEATAALITLRNLVDHRLAVQAATLDRLGVAAKHGGKLRNLLVDMGLPPAATARTLRAASSPQQMPTTTRHAADGALSGEHVDAIVRGLAHIERRIRRDLTAGEQAEHEKDLLAQTFSGASPADIAERARSLANQLVEDSGTDVGVAAADDRSIDTVDAHTDPDGRVQVAADLDAVIGEKFLGLIDRWSRPRPEPDGSPDARSSGRRRADALETILDRAAGASDAAGTNAPLAEVVVTIPADSPDLARLDWVGPASQTTTRHVACDSAVTEVVVDGQSVPLDVGRTRRLCPTSLRKAVGVRDGGRCIKCGAPGSWSHVHHMVHWADGGTTCLDNCCLLCPSCHADVHAHGWEVVLGLDRHPWLVPPESVDPRRRPQPAYNRRTMRLDDALAA